MVSDLLVDQSTKGGRGSGILILPIYCLFLSMHGFLCSDKEIRGNLVLKETSG
jgi:hypothetical protein